MASSNDDDNEVRAPGSTLRAYLELVRLPNVFTAIADVMMGFLVVRRAFDPRYILLELVAVSSCLYLAGMVFNDVFDREIDADERPERPIPSGRVSVGAARTLGFALLVLALALAGRASWELGMFMPLAIAGAIAVLLLLYDKWLKHTLLGPVAMGGCRFLNVLLGMSAVIDSLGPLEWIIAAGVGVYVMGVTIFARKEAESSRRSSLIFGVVVMLVGMGLIAFLPKLLDDWRLKGLPQGWPLFWAVLVGHIVWRCARAISKPEPQFVQAAVKNCIMSIIVVDAAASMTTAGLAQFALAILVLIIPATMLGRWIYST